MQKNNEDLLGQAMWDYYKKGSDKGCQLFVNSNIPHREKYPIDYFLRSWGDMSAVDQYALELCCGHILDVGAGAGVHALELQKHTQVLALDSSPLCVRLMKLRGVLSPVLGDFYSFKSPVKFDTLLLLMNGLGISKTIKNFPLFLDKCHSLLSKNGQVIIDTSDVAYLYKDDLFPANKYYGEINFRWEYKGMKSKQFSWLYLDDTLIKQLCQINHWTCELVFESEDCHHLYRLRPDEVVI